MIDLDKAELYVGDQVQRVGRQFLRRQTKTDTSEAPLALPDLCITALRLRKRQQAAGRPNGGAISLGSGSLLTLDEGPYMHGVIARKFPGVCDDATRAVTAGRSLDKPATATGVGLARDGRPFRECSWTEWRWSR